MRCERCGTDPQERTITDEDILSLQHLAARMDIFLANTRDDNPVLRALLTQSAGLMRHLTVTPGKLKG